MTSPGFLYAVSWEVCNPGGGVHTVLATSAPVVHAHYGSDLLFVGPDLWAEREVQADFVPDAVQPPLAALAAERDVPVRFGRWNVGDSPAVALVDYGRLLEAKNRILGDLWSDHAVDSIHADWDTVERILFGYAAGTLVELHYHATVRPRAVRAVAHFHQWVGCSGLLRLARTCPEIGTVYTPHGTALGRAMATEGLDPRTAMETADALDWAKERGIEAQHSLEVAGAREASVLTVVSEQSVQEAARLLGRRPDLITPNGFSLRTPPDPARRGEVRKAILGAASRIVGSRIDPKRTRVVFSSGRYEFRNKGFEVALRAASRLRKHEPKPPRDLLLLIFASAPQTGRRPEIVQRLDAAELAGAPCGICTHNLARPEEDPILRTCREEGLDNRAEDPVKAIFVPVMLNGRDPLFPFTYLDVLQASDLSLFPSLYEPWGYTPLESLAAGVPTVTTDVTGIGRFLLALPPGERRAATVLPAGDGLAASLTEELFRFLGESDEELEVLRRAGGDVVARTSWEKLIGPTFEAHRRAFATARKRRGTAIGPGFSALSRGALTLIEAKSEDRPRLHAFVVATSLPGRIGRLQELAKNLWWSWNTEARELFEGIDAHGFAAADANPLRFLRGVDPNRLLAAARDEGLLKRYDAVLADLDAYRSRPPADAPRTAYFCAEYGIHECLPVYSGGLGVLAGDHLRSASDLHLPLSAVGLRYANGYFVQRILPDGSQGVEFVAADLADLPIEEVKAKDGTPLRIAIRMPERTLRARAFRVDVGRVPLYLLDTLVPENDPADQNVTDRLYPSDRESRLRQEILLGIGGWMLLKAIGDPPEVCHLNEGHSAFLLLERMLNLVEEQGLTYAEAAEVVRASTAFTTHTPVPAGHDRFSEGLMRRYFGHVAHRLGLSWDAFLDLGRASRDEQEFSMTVLALKLSGRANGVSRLHGDVSRRMLSNVWPGLHRAETPVYSITNGVHLGAWAGPEIDRFLRRHLSPDWALHHPPSARWHALRSVPDEEVWKTHTAQKLRLLDFVRDSVEQTGLRRGENPVALRRRLEGIDDDALWIGFARRFAPYKRATLVFQDPARLHAILADSERPVRIVFAGKSHPDDREGADLVRKVVEYTQDSRFAGRVFFLEDYGLAAGRMLVQGCDVWLNTPTRPLEASGTSGMKAVLNGVLQLSILDGWWCEGYDGTNGWGLGEGREHSNPEMQLEYDSRSLYGLLEARVASLFFDRDAKGIPAGWIEMMKNAWATIPDEFNTHRMVEEYLRTAYVPLAQETAKIVKDGFAEARERAKHHAQLTEAWKDVRIEDVSVTDPKRGNLGIGDVFEVRAKVRLGSLAPEAISVELYVGPSDRKGELSDPVVIPLLREGDVADGTATYTGAYLPRGAGSFQYGVRVLPAVDGLHEVAHLGLVRWA
ncbi:MAG TPA: alpha-glucan family phosphorylase [Planctomycetota bacterium]|nr:alpha-glucan family phosphorylase [Planctomycetota bacterium]